MAISSLFSLWLYLCPEPLHHTRPVLVRNISVLGNPKRCFETLIKSTIWFPSQLVHLLDILLYCALVVRGQSLRPQTLQSFRVQVGPNCSSSRIRMPSLTPVRMVGSPPDGHNCFVHVLLHFVGQIVYARFSKERTRLAG